MTAEYKEKMGQMLLALIKENPSATSAELDDLFRDRHSDLFDECWNKSVDENTLWLEFQIRRFKGEVSKPAETAASDAEPVSAPASRPVALTTHSATDFIKRLFQPGDLLCFAFGGNRRPWQQRFHTYEEATQPAFIGKLLEWSDGGYNIYVGMNACKSRKRTRDNVAAVRTVWAEIDENGRENLANILASKLVPEPTIVTESSPGKYHVIWSVEGLTVPEAEAVVKRIADEFGGDKNACDAARVLRVPGFKNLKYPEKPEVKVVRVAQAGAKHTFEDFESLAPVVAPTPAKTEQATSVTGVSVPVTIADDLWISESRDNTLTSIAGALRCRALGRDDIEAVLTSLVEKHVAQHDEGKTSRDAKRIAESVSRDSYAPEPETVLIGGKPIDPNAGTVLVGLQITKDAKVEEIRKLISPPASAEPEPLSPPQSEITPLIVSVGDDFLKRDIPPRRAFLEMSVTGEPVIFEQSINQIFAWRGSGKTCFGLGLTRALATGGELLCFKAPERVRVLYVEGELPASQMQERWRNLVGCTDGYAFLCTMDDQTDGYTSLMSPVGRAKVEATLADLKAKGSPIQVLFLDSISTLFNANANEEETWVQIQPWLLSLRSRGITVCFMHHSGKTGMSRSHSKSEDPLDLSVKLSTPENHDPSLLHCTLEIDKARSGLSLRPFDFKMHREHSDACACNKMTAPHFCPGDGARWEMLNPPDTKKSEAEHLFSIGQSIQEVAVQLELPTGTINRWRTEWGRKNKMSESLKGKGRSKVVEFRKSQTDKNDPTPLYGTDQE